MGDVLQLEAHRISSRSMVMTGRHFFARNERGPNADDLARAILMRHALAGHADPGDRHAVDLAADLDRLFAGPGARGDPDGDLVGLRLDVGGDTAPWMAFRPRKSIRRSSASRPTIRKRSSRILLRELGASQRTRAGIEEHVFADEAFMQPIDTLRVGVRGLPRYAADPNPVVADLLELGGREIDDHIRRDVVRRIVHLIEELLL